MSDIAKICYFVDCDYDDSLGYDKLLQGIGIEVKMFDSPFDATLALTKRMPDFIIIEFDHLKKLGLSFLKNLHYQKEYHNIPTLGIIDACSTQAKNALKGMGLDYFIEKPFSSVAYMQLINRILLDAKRAEHYFTLDNPQQIDVEVEIEITNISCDRFIVESPIRFVPHLSFPLIEFKDLVFPSVHEAVGQVVTLHMNASDHRRFSALLNWIGLTSDQETEIRSNYVRWKV